MVAVMELQKHLGITTQMVEQAGWKELVPVMKPMEEYAAKKNKREQVALSVL